MNAIVPAFGCATEGVPFNVALASVLGLAMENVGTEYVPLSACVGRIIAAPFDARFMFLSARSGAICHRDEIEVVLFEPGAIASRGKTVHE